MIISKLKQTSVSERQKEAAKDTAKVLGTATIIYLLYKAAKIAVTACVAPPLVPAAIVTP